MKILILLVLILSCSTTGSNITKKGIFHLREGVHGERSWDDHLVFDRYSWYKDLTLVFELFTSKVTQRSPFYSWFSEDEKITIEKCLDFRVVLIYNLDNKKISQSDYFDQMKGRYGYEKIPVNSFVNELRMHPSFENNSLQLYRVSGLCRKLPNSKGLKLRFPGYKDVVLSVL